MSKKLRTKKQALGEDIQEKTLDQLLGRDHTYEYPGFNTAAEYESFINDLSSTALQNEATKRSIIPNQDSKTLKKKLMQLYNTAYYRYNTAEREAEIKERHAETSVEIPKTDEQKILAIMRRGK
jgi:hypothetical protein